VPLKHVRGLFKTLARCRLPNNKDQHMSLPLAGLQPELSCQFSSNFLFHNDNYWSREVFVLHSKPGACQLICKQISFVRPMRIVKRYMQTLQNFIVVQQLSSTSVLFFRRTTAKIGAQTASLLRFLRHTKLHIYTHAQTR
jgi:hypothetical protein